MEENSSKENETQVKPYVIANPVENPNDSSNTNSSPFVVNNVTDEETNNDVKPYVIANPDENSDSSNSNNDSNNDNGNDNDNDDHKGPIVKDIDTSSSMRFNPVTGEEINTTELLDKKEDTEVLDVDEIDNSEKLKTIEVDYQPTSTANTVMLVIFFIFLILFVVFLPNIQTLIAEYRNRDVVPEEITTGTLVCELSTNTTNLDTEYERKFEFTDKQLKSAKFSTTIRGNESLDGDILTDLNKKCQQVKQNVESIGGVNISCNYESGKVKEVESFDYSTFNYEDVVSAYTEAGADLPEFELDQDIDEVKTLMSRSGFSCNIRGK